MDEAQRRKELIKMDSLWGLCLDVVIVLDVKEHVSSTDLRFGARHVIP